MRSFVVGENIDLNTAASQTPIDMSALTQDYPFVTENSCVVAFWLEGPAGTAFILEGREDSTGAFTTIAQVVAADGPGVFYKNITLQQEIRITVTGTAGAGITGSIALLNN